MAGDFQNKFRIDSYSILPSKRALIQSAALSGTINLSQMANEVFDLINTHGNTKDNATLDFLWCFGVDVENALRPTPGVKAAFLKALSVYDQTTSSMQIFTHGFKGKPFVDALPPRLS